MKNSAIQWTHHTFNPWIGCAKVAPECKFCYAEEQQDHRYGRVKWGKGQPRSRTAASYWRQPLKWNEEASDERKRVFCASLADVFDEEVDSTWRHDLFHLILNTPNLDWLLLTKRPEFARTWFELCGWPDFPNIWLGVSAGVDPRPLLGIPAPVHFLSCEPMLKPLDRYFLPNQEFDWIIFGGESGKNARICWVDWIKEGIEFCRRNDIAPFVKQLGSNVGGSEHDKWVAHIKDSHGGDITEWSKELQVREFPTQCLSPRLK
jgi:protein gp37